MFRIVTTACAHTQTAGEYEDEELYGGPCDGVVLTKTDSPIMYSGRLGDGTISTYRRGPDGRLRYSATEKIRGRNQ